MLAIISFIAPVCCIEIETSFFHLRLIFSIWLLGTILGTMYIQIPSGWTRRPLLFADWASTKHSRKQGVHRRNHVWVLQCTRAIHCSASRPCFSCVLDLSTSWWKNVDRDCHWFGRWCHSCHPCSKFRTL